MMHVWRPDDCLEELTLSFHHVGLGIEFRSSGLEAGAFTSRAISLAWGFRELYFI